jgi:branched-chain amino acid transport system substrate-binding protein
VRRINLRAVGLVAIAGMLAAGTAACQSTTTTTTASCGGKLGIFGAFTGGDSGLVIPSKQGAELAVSKHNAAHPDCQVTLVYGDSQGSADQATPFANAWAADPSILGVIGGHFSGESAATTPIFTAAGLVMISPSATRVDLTSAPSAFTRVVGNDGTQGRAVAAALAKQGATKAYAVDDKSPYGAGIVDELVKAATGSIEVKRGTVEKNQQEFSTLVNDIKAFAPQAIFYGGYTTEAAPLVKQLREAGVTAPFIGPDGLYDPNFPKGAAGGAEGAIITCPCLPGSKVGGNFAADFKAATGVEPGSYAAEGYDAAQIFLDAFLAGKQTRKDIWDFVKAYDKEGLSKYIKFDANGDVDPSKVVIWTYTIKGETFEPLAPVSLS